MTIMDTFDYIQWQPEYKTGVEKIDDGHLQFVKIYNQLVDVLQKDYCRQKIVELLYALIHYAEHHLINEEICYRGYDGFAAHKAKHQEFIDKINQIRTYLVEQDSNEACRQLLIYLHKWFTNHILEHDREAVEYVKKRD